MIRNNLNFSAFISIVLLGFTLLSDCWTRSVCWAGDRDPLVVTIVPSKDSYCQLEPVAVTLEVKNAPGRNVDVLDHVLPYRDIKFYICDKDGHSAPETKYCTEMMMVPYIGSYPFAFPSRPGTDVRFRQRLALNLFCDMTSPGAYTVEVRFP